MPKKDLLTGLYIINYENPFYKDYIIKPNQRNQKRIRTRKERTIIKENATFNNLERKSKKWEEIKQNISENNNIKNIGNKNEKNEEKIIIGENINDILETAETHTNDNN